RAYLAPITTWRESLSRMSYQPSCGKGFLLLLWNPRQKKSGEIGKRLNMISAQEVSNASRKQILEWCGCFADAGNDPSRRRDAEAGEVHISRSQPVCGRGREQDRDAGL